MKKIIMILLIGLIIQSCKKQESTQKALSSLTLVNTSIDIVGLKLNTSGLIQSWSGIPAGNVTNFANSKHYGVFVGTRSVTVTVAADSTKTLYSASQEFKEGAFNTLFLCGQTGSYEGVYLTDENLPNYTEEVVSIRFINLSPNSPAVSINLTATPAVNEAANLVYKQKSEFKTYPAGNVAAGIAFQVKNAVTGSLLASYTLPAAAVSPYTTATVAQARFKNVTLVIKGLAGTTTGTNAFGVFPVAHY